MRKFNNKYIILSIIVTRYSITIGSCLKKTKQGIRTTKIKVDWTAIIIRKIKIRGRIIKKIEIIIASWAKKVTFIYIKAFKYY